MNLSLNRNLSYKAILGHHWISSFCPNADLVVKSDDDFFVDLPMLRHLHSSFICIKTQSSARYVLAHLEGWDRRKLVAAIFENSNSSSVRINIATNDLTQRAWIGSRPQWLSVGLSSVELGKHACAEGGRRGRWGLCAECWVLSFEFWGRKWVTLSQELQMLSSVTLVSLWL